MVVLKYFPPLDALIVIRISVPRKSFQNEMKFHKHNYNADINKWLQNQRKVIIYFRIKYKGKEVSEHCLVTSSLNTLRNASWHWSLQIPSALLRHFRSSRSGKRGMLRRQSWDTLAVCGRALSYWKMASWNPAISAKTYGWRMLRTCDWAVTVPLMNFRGTVCHMQWHPIPSHQL